MLVVEQDIICIHPYELGCHDPLHTDPFEVLPKGVLHPNLQCLLSGFRAVEQLVIHVEGEGLIEVDFRYTVKSHRVLNLPESLGLLQHLPIVLVASVAAESKCLRVVAASCQAQEQEEKKVMHMLLYLITPTVF